MNELLALELDQLPLHTQMRWAAKILEAANERCGMPPNMSWTATDLLTESAVVAAEVGAL